MTGAYIALAIFVVIFAACAWFAARDERRQREERD